MGTEYRRHFIAYDWSRLTNARLQTPPGKDGSESASSSKPKVQAGSTDNISNHLHARLQVQHVASLCPPWSTPFCSYVREQPTTLKPQMTRVSDGLVHAQEHLETRRFQPTYADHGLDFRLAKQKPSARRGMRKSKSVATTPGVQVMEPKKAALTVAYQPMKQPHWWGQSALPKEPDRPTYEDLGSHYPRNTTTIAGKEMLRAESLPVLNGKYEHDNPFLGTGSAYRRAPGGAFVCDVSLAEKP